MNHRMWIEVSELDRSWRISVVWLYIPGRRNIVEPCISLIALRPPHLFIEQIAPDHLECTRLSIGYIQQLNKTDMVPACIEVTL